MDTLKGKQIMVWTFMGNARMYEALRDYGDRISQIGLFSFKVRATGEIYESGVAISDMLTYINKWPHIKWLLTVANDGANSIFRALRDNTNGAQEMFLSEIIRIMEKYPWCDGIDIDLERGDGYSTHAASTAMFQNIYNTVKNYDATKHMNICLPGMTSVNGSVGGENWCVYGDLDSCCDTASIMSYGMAWAGSAPGPVSPRSWLEGIYDYATRVMDPDKIFLGMPAYGWNWQIYDTPENLGETYRGVSNTYYAARYWMTGAYNFTGDAPPQPFLPIVAYWDDYDKVPYAFPHVYDYMEGADAVSREYPQLADTYNRRRYLTAYGKEQKTEFGTIFIDRDADGYSSASGIVSIENGIATLGDNGSVTYSFTVNVSGNLRCGGAALLSLLGQERHLCGAGRQHKALHGKPPVVAVLAEYLLGVPRKRCNALSRDAYHHHLSGRQRRPVLRLPRLLRLFRGTYRRGGHLRPCAQEF